jgi:hypothetical protein
MFIAVSGPDEMLLEVCRASVIELSKKGTSHPAGVHQLFVEDCYKHCAPPERRRIKTEDQKQITKDKDPRTKPKAP